MRCVSKKPAESGELRVPESCYEQKFWVGDENSISKHSCGCSKGNMENENYILWTTNGARDNREQL